MQQVNKDFFAQSTTTVARQLLWMYLIHDSSDGCTIGRIVETEAYLTGDPANHAWRGVTKRNAVMFGPPGAVYVYAIYGQYVCVNVVTEKQGIGEAVLIRALEPLKGRSIMERRRGCSDMTRLCNGPSKLALAMEITLNHNGWNLALPPLTIMSDYPL